MLNVQLVTPPSIEPVSVEQLRAHLRMDTSFTLDDTILGVYLTAARQYAEQYTRRAFLPQQWCLSLDHFPIPRCRTTLTPSERRNSPWFSSYLDQVAILLPKPRCVSVDSISYLDCTGTEQTLASGTYTVDTSSQPARVVPLSGLYWPLTTTYLPGTVKVSFTAASFATVQDVPQTLVMAIMLLAAHWYAHSESSSSVSLSEIPFGVSALLDMHKHTVLTYEAA